MILNLFSFILLTASLYLAVLYKSTAACALFFFLSICFFLGILQIFYLARRLKLWIPDIVLDSRNTGHLTFSLSAENSGFLPVSCAKIKLSLLDINNQKLHTDSLVFSVLPKKQIILPVELSSSCCGKFQIKADYIRIFSFCSLLNKKLHINLSAKALFYPNLSLLPVTVSETTRFFSAENDEFDDIIPGIPHVPMNQIREFQPGDRVRQIHWKLSARTDELLVRDAGKPDGFPVLLFLEPSRPKQNNPSAWYSSFLEFAASLSFSLLEAKCRHFVIWYDSREQSVVRYPIRQEEELYTCIYYLLHEKPCDSDNNLYELYSRKFPSDTYQTSLLLNTRLELYKNQASVFSCTESRWYEKALSCSLIV